MAALFARTLYQLKSPAAIFFKSNPFISKDKEGSFARKTKQNAVYLGVIKYF